LSRSWAAPYNGVVRLFRFGSWAWRAALAAYWLLSLIGLGLPRGAVANLLLSGELWLTNKVDDPILFAFVTGLMFSTFVAPAVWKVVHAKLWSKELTREKLGIFATEGVDLRNKAHGAEFTQEQWRAWEKELVEWRNRVQSTIEQFSRADAKRWRTLNRIPHPAIPIRSDSADGRAEYSYAVHNFRIHKLEQLIDRYAEN
jgi:hypothetical protein